MKYAFKFSNLCGTVYKSGNVVFTPDGNSLLSPVSNRVTLFDLVGHSSTTLDFETRSDIDRIAVSPDSRLLLVVDVDGYALAVNLARRAVLHRFNFKERVRDLQFSPDSKYIAVTHARKIQVWRTPGLEREFSPFVLHRTYTGHFDDVTSIDWSPNGEYFVTGSKDMTARIYTLDPKPGFIPVTLSGHRDRVVGAYFAAKDTIYSVSRDGAVYVWTWTERPLLSADAVSALEEERARLEAAETAEAGADDDDEGDDDVEPLDGAGAGAGAGGGAGAGAGGGLAGRKRRRAAAAEQDTSVLKRAASLVEESAADRIRARGSVAALASRVRHAVPAPFSAADAGTGVDADALSIARGEWVLQSKHYFRQEGAKVKSVALYKRTGLLVVGFTTGVFGLYTMPNLDTVHTLSISQHNIHSVAVNASGDWLAFGSRTLGQLLVWEWASETYVLKQQGHFFDVNCTAYSPNGQLIATGGDDGKVKVWNVATGFCFVTFSEHKAPVTAVTFIGGRGGHGLAVVSASLDGSVRAYDLVRYRNFRTFTTPTPVQFISLAAEEGGEVVCAGGLDPFNIYVWSVQTGKLLDVLAGHEGPVCGLHYSGAAGLLASCSWDKTVKLWDVFRAGAATESFRHGTDVLAVAFRPDGEQLAASCLDGQIAMWDVKRGVQVSSIDGRRDAAGGRKHGDAMSAARNASSKHFTTLCWSADGESLLAGGRTKYICLYAVAPKLLLRKWQISHNRSHDGVLDKLNSKGMGEGGVPLAQLQVDPTDDAEDERALGDDSLPGTKKQDAASSRRAMLEVRSKAVQFSPTGRAFAVASTDGLLVYSLDDSLVFDPFELGEDVTVEAAEAALEDGAYARSLLLALHMNETPLLLRVTEAVPAGLVRLLAAAVPLAFVQRLMDIIASRLAPGEGASPHVEFYLTWALALLQAHSRGLRERASYFAGSLRTLQRALISQRESLAKLIEGNKYMLQFLCAVAGEGDDADADSEGREEEEEEVNAGAGGAAGGAGAGAGAGAGRAASSAAWESGDDDEGDGEGDDEDWLGPSGASSAAAAAAPTASPPARASAPASAAAAAASASASKGAPSTGKSKASSKSKVR